MHSLSPRTLIFQPVTKDPTLCSTVQTTQTVHTADPVARETHRLIAKQQKLSFWKKSSTNQNISCSISYSGKKEEHFENWEQATLLTQHGVSRVILTHVHFCVTLSHHLPGLSGENLKLILFLSSILKAEGVWSYRPLTEVQCIKSSHKVHHREQTKKHTKGACSSEQELGVPAAPQFQLAASRTLLTRE